jgi:ABC-type transport system substrate-binding protein
VDRRAFLKAAAGVGAVAAAGGLATPAISQRAAARALRFVPQADLSNFDPIWTTANIARHAGVLVWDTLYGVDEKLQPRRQMVEAEEVSTDGLDWTFRLRPGLKFHDGEPVLAKDVVATWFDATTLDEERAIARRLNKAALDHVVCAPIGFFLRQHAWRRNVSGIVQAPLPLFWGVRKTV